MSNYPDSDYPWTFYFNGVAMPRWSQCWRLSKLLELSRSSIEKWGERIAYRDLWLLECRIDHVGVVESEDAMRFQVLGLHLLNTLLNQERDVLASLKDPPSSAGISHQDVYAGIRDGLFEMVKSAGREHLAFWTTGYEADRVALVEIMRRHSLPPGNPDFLEASHVARERREAESRYDSLRKELIAKIHKSTLFKELRTRIHELPRLQ